MGVDVDLINNVMQGMGMQLVSNIAPPRPPPCCSWRQPASSAPGPTTLSHDALGGQQTWWDVASRPTLRAAAQVGPYDDTSNITQPTYTFICKPADIRVTPIINILTNS